MLTAGIAVSGSESENSERITSYLLPSMCVQNLAQNLVQNVILEKIPTVKSDNHALLLQTNMHT
jgi:hypothetical protein